MPSKRGFLLPQTINPDDDTCLIVHIPRGEEYRAAFFGQMEKLGYWWSWERDSEKRGKDAAARFRESIARTWDTWQELGDICEMDITVNVVQQCCENNLPTIILNNNLHIGQGTIDEFLALPGGQADNGEDAPNDSWATYQGYLVDKCAYANQLADDLLLTFENLGNFGITLAGVSFAVLQTLVTTTSISGIIAGTVAASTGVWAACAAIVVLIIGLGVYGAQVYTYFESCAEELDKGTLVCAMYGATDAATARSRLLEAFGDAGVASLVEGQPGGPQFLQIWTQVAQWVMPIELMEPLFDTTDYVQNLPNSDCTSCQGVIPPAPEGLLDSITHYWELEEANYDRYDSVGSLHMPVASGTQIAGISGFGVRTNGNNQFFMTASDKDPEKFFGSSTWTINLWFYMAVDVTQGESVQTITQLNDITNNFNADEFVIQANYHASAGFNNLLCIFSNGGSGRYVYAGDNPFAIGEWHMITVSRNVEEGLYTVQVDDADVGAYAIGPPPTSSTNNREFVIGGLWNYGQLIQDFNGYVDEFSWHNRALTQTERDWMYNSGFGRSLAEYSN